MAVNIFVRALENKVGLPIVFKLPKVPSFGRMTQSAFPAQSIFVNVIPGVAIDAFPAHIFKFGRKVALFAGG